MALSDMLMSIGANAGYAVPRAEMRTEQANRRAEVANQLALQRQQALAAQERAARQEQNQQIAQYLPDNMGGIAELLTNSTINPSIAFDMHKYQADLPYRQQELSLKQMQQERLVREEDMKRQLIDRIVQPPAHGDSSAGAANPNDLHALTANLAIQEQMKNYGLPASPEAAKQRVEMAREISRDHRKESLGEIGDLTEKARDARVLIDNLNQQEKNLKDSGYTGPGNTAYGIFDAVLFGSAEGTRAAREAADAMATQIQLELSSKLSGSISEGELGIIAKGVPNRDNTQEGNKKIIDASKFAARRVIEHKKFKEAYYRKHGNTLGADEAWGAYIGENTLVNRDFSINRKNLTNWKGYLDYRASSNPGDIPLGMNEKPSLDNISPEDVRFTAEKYGISEDEVIRKLGEQNAN